MKLIAPAFATVALALTLSATQASVLDTATTSAAGQTEVYGVFHDRPTNFVFVKMPQGWAFVGKDEHKSHHEVFHDAVTGFVFVKLSGGWKFLGNVDAA